MGFPPSARDIGEPAAVSDTSAVTTAPWSGVRHHSIPGAILQLFPLPEAALRSSTQNTTPVYLPNCEDSAGLLAEACGSGNNSPFKPKLVLNSQIDKEEQAGVSGITDGNLAKLTCSPAPEEILLSLQQVSLHCLSLQ